MRKAILLLCGLFAFMVTAFAQTRQVTGKVVDKKGETLIGVSVGLKGANTGVSTDVNGNFKINVPSTGSHVLVFKYVGFKTKEVSVSQQSKISVTLEESSTELDAVVVVGYGTAKKKDLTGAVATINSDVIAAAPVSSALQAMQGRVSGVQITTTEGSPDAEMTIRVRGGASITQSSSPLFVVDGFQYTSMPDIAPTDIESMTVLKDASSTAIYGSRGGNGVVLITTKSGKSGKTSVSYSVFGGTKQLANKLDLISPYDYTKWQYERALLDNSITDYTKYFGNYQDMDLYKNVPTNDWQDIVFGRTGTTYNQNLTISGGTDKTKFSVSHSYVKDKAIMLLSGFERHNANFKLNQKLYDKLSLDLGFRYADIKTEGAGANEQREVSSADSRLKNVMIYPAIPVAGLSNSTETDPDFNLYNPIVSITDNDQFVHRKTYNLSAAVNYDPNKVLRFRSEFAYDGYRNDQDRFYGRTTYYVTNVPTSTNQGFPALTLTNTNRNGIRNTNTLNLDLKKYLNKDHNLTWLVGQEFIKTSSIDLTNVVHGFPATFTFNNARKLTTQGKDAFSINNNYGFEDKLFSVFTRANYDYKSRYLFSATFRADGSSKFLKNQYGYFPGVSAGWRISDEDFMKVTKSWLNDLKLRASYGAVGNNDILSGQGTTVYSSTNTSYVNGATSFWAPSKILPNPELKWETNITRNLGADFTLFNSKLSGTLEAYKNSTKDLLMLFPLSGGYTGQYQNIGQTENKGWEASLNWSAIRKKDFDLTISANISANKNKVVSLGGVQNISQGSGWASTAVGVDYLVEPGSPIGNMYGYVSDGRYEVSDFSGFASNRWNLNSGVADATTVVGTIRPGSLKLKDLNNDGKIDLSDRKVIGNANPLNVGGFNINARYKSFDFATYWNWSYGNDVYNANKIEYTSTSQYSSRNMLSIMESGQRWNNLREDGTISNDPAELTAMNANTTLWSPYMSRYVFTDWAVEDASFLRLGTVTLGYSLPKKLISHIGIKNARIYASGYNLLLFTDYTGFDPEVSTRRQTPLTPGVDYSAYPKSKSYVFGLNVNF
ncbi:SusC/RagA family TonB-linked outer membrane protein [Desertivirga arenae]|uniref:SusC/RagA family TonB-linked outer membrane protein n=1 Tax=Desertivirga arenae TaxID=2810309 RepID=UPI001A96BFAB|nr:TonB-dependent receptor [Pedobacter sp. SYSU D00823]